MQHTDEKLHSRSYDEWLLTQEEEELIWHRSVEAEKERMIAKLSRLKSDIELKQYLALRKWEKALDKAKILQIANTAKIQEVWHKENREKRRQEAAQKLQQLKQRCGAGYMLELVQKHAEVKSRHKKLILTNDTKKIIVPVCYFLAEDEKFEKVGDGFSLNKGLLIRGKSGLGKTFVLEALKNNERIPVTVYHMLEIEDEVKRNGEFFPELNGIIVLDDVGTESNAVKYYGTEINWFKNFIERYHSRSLSFNRLIITTNLDSDEIEQRYSYRVRSRMREMFNVINADGEELR